MSQVIHAPLLPGIDKHLFLLRQAKLKADIANASLALLEEELAFTLKQHESKIDVEDFFNLDVEIDGEQMKLTQRGDND